jgi:colanic acid/amylovoran biosynthesis glycosyltransferase
MKSKTIAIYSGEIPSTTFIERLIIGLTNSGFIIYLFGKQKKKTKHSKNIRLFTYSNKFSKLFTLLKYSFLLLVFKANDKRKLDEIIKLQKGNSWLKKIKYYPVLYQKPDVFHLQWAKGVEDWIWVQEFGMKFVLSLRGAHVNYTPITLPEYKDIYKKYFPRVDGFHAVSNAILKESLNYGAFESNIKTIYSGFDLNKLEYLSKNNFQTDKLSIISIGRSHWKKGYNYALDAFSILKQDGFDFEYSIIGVEDEEELLFQRNQLDLEAEVVFKKGLAFEQIIKEINKADIVLLPSVEEGIANVVLEAMALGTIVISTNCGGMEEIVKKEENGFIVPIRNSKEIAATIKKVSALSLEKHNEITLKARVAIENQHSNKKMIHDFNAFYESILNKEKAL